MEKPPEGCADNIKRKGWDVFTFVHVSMTVGERSARAAKGVQRESVCRPVYVRLLSAEWQLSTVALITRVIALLTFLPFSSALLPSPRCLLTWIHTGESLALNSGDAHCEYFPALLSLSSLHRHSDSSFAHSELSGLLWRISLYLHSVRQNQMNASHEKILHTDR